MSKRVFNFKDWHPPNTEGLVQERRNSNALTHRYDFSNALATFRIVCSADKVLISHCYYALLSQTNILNSMKGHLRVYHSLFVSMEMKSRTNLQFGCLLLRKNWIKSVSEISLQGRHNGHDSVSNHQPHHCLLNRLFRRRSKKTSKPRVTSLCAGIHDHRWIPRTNGQ